MSKWSNAMPSETQWLDCAELLVQFQERRAETQQSQATCPRPDPTGSIAPAPEQSAPHSDARVVTDEDIFDRIVKVLDLLPLERRIPIVKALCEHMSAAARARLNIKVVQSA